MRNEVQSIEKFVPPISSACNFVNPNIVKSILKFSILPIYSESQLRETLNDAQLKANITAFRLSKYVPQAYKFVFTNLESLDYSPLLFKKKNTKLQKRVSFNPMKEIKQIQTTHLSDNCFEKLNTTIRTKENKIRLMYFALDFSIKELLF